MKKRKIINKSLKKKYRKISKDVWDNKHFLNQEKQIKEALKNSEQTEEEKKLWKEFLNNVEKDKNNIDEFDKGGNGKFKLKHVEDLKVNYDILFLYGKKGIGKTVQLGRLVNKIAEENDKGIVVLIRNTAQEMEALAKQLSTSDNWPIYMQGQALFHKFKRLGKKKRYMGFATYLTGEAIKATQGPEYKNVKAIIWDECNYTGSQFGIGSKELTKFVIFVSSIVRDNKDVKFYMFGNYLRNEDSTTSNIFLESAGINPECKLKLLEFKTEDGKDITRMLYINTGSLYKGMESQKYVGMFGHKVVKDMVNNMPESLNPKVISLKDFLDCSPVWAFVFYMKGEELILYFSTAYIEENKPPHFVCRIENYDHEKTYLFKPFTDNANIFNKYSPKMFLKTTEEIENHLIGLYSAFLSSNLWYSGEDTELFFRDALDKWIRKYKMNYENTEWV